METVKTQTCIVKNAPVHEDTAFWPRWPGQQYSCTGPTQILPSSPPSSAQNPTSPFASHSNRQLRRFVGCLLWPLQHQR